MDWLLYSFLAGTSTVIGALLLCLHKSPGIKSLPVLLGFAGGIMMGISVFELIPDAVIYGSILMTIIGFLLGGGLMYLADRWLPHAHLSKSDLLVVENPENLTVKMSPILRSGYLILFGVALHNLPEGLAIGAGLEASPQLGMMIAVTIGLHNIPEGMAMAGPLRAGGLSMIRTVMYTLLAGLMVPVGAAIGYLAFRISTSMLGVALAFAAGAMIYIVNDELLPQAFSMNKHLATAGLLAGLLVTFWML